MEPQDVIKKVEAVVRPILDGYGFEWVDAEYLSEQSRWVLRLYIDKPGGITLDDISLVSREASSILDVEDVIPHRYVLEVSSPGLARPLAKPAHFERALGKRASIKARTPLDGRRNFKAVIDSVSGDAVNVTDFDGKKFSIRFDNIAKARLEFEF
jgi:ribosome maturation factor RimP